MKKTFYAFLLLALTSTGLSAQWTQGLLFTPSISLIEEVHFSGPSFGFAAATSNGSPNGYILKSTDGGANWTLNYTSPVGTVNDVHFPAGQTAIGYASGAKLYKTTNAGVSWDSIYTPSEDGGKLWFTSTTEGYMSGAVNSGFFWKTTDGGLTWNALTIPGFRPHQIQFLSSTMGFVAGGDPFSGGSGEVIKTTDGGMNWTTLDYTPALSGQATGGFDGMFWVDQNNGYVGGQGGIMVHTTDGGLNWTQVATSDPDSATITDIWFTSPSVGFYSTILGRIFATNNGGASWTLSGSNQGGQFAIYCLEFSNSQKGFGGGLLGTYLYTTNAGGSVAVTPSMDASMGISITPNPGNGSFRIASLKDLGNEVELEITDMDGRVVHSQPASGWELQAGIDFDLQLAAGMYAVTVKAAGDQKTLRLIVE